MSLPSKTTLGYWRPAITAAASEVATYALSWPGAVVRDPVGLEATVSMIGAHIPMVGTGRAFDLALVSSYDGCQSLARAILCMDAGPPLEDRQVADAIGEIVNMLGGSMKRRLSGVAADLTLGLPIFIHGYIQPSERLSVLALPIRFGAVETVVMIAGTRE